MTILKLLIALERHQIWGPFRYKHKLIWMWNEKTGSTPPRRLFRIIKRHKQHLLARVLTTAQAGIPESFVLDIVQRGGEL